MTAFLDQNSLEKSHFNQKQPSKGKDHFEQSRPPTGIIYLILILDKSQERVTGTVKVRIYKGALKILARFSSNALYSEDLVSFDSQTIDQKDAEGFAKYHGFQRSWIVSGLQ